MAEASALGHIRVAIAFVIVAAAGVGPALGSPAMESSEEARVSFVVGLHEVPDDLAPGDAFHGAHVDKVNRPVRYVGATTSDPVEFRARALLDANVRYVESDEPLPLLFDAESHFIPDDPQYGSMYGPQQVRADLAWDTTLGDLDASVCVIDTGIRYTHEDLAGTRWLGGYDFVNEDADPWDDHGHGTHVSGTAAGAINNAIGVAGMGNVGHYGVKVLDAGGSGTWSDVADGITWCADNTMTRTVLSMSLGGSSPNQAVEDAVNYAYNTQGKLVVAAAGNSGCDPCVGYPAAYQNATAVTCTTVTEAICSFSSRGPQAEIAAPGHNILSTWNADDASYNTISGTSMSTPHVSGVAALYWSHDSTITNVELRQRLRDTSVDLGASGHDNSYGSGRLDAACLFEGNTSCVTVAEPPTEPQEAKATGLHQPGELTVRWFPPTTGIDSVGAYRVYRSDASGGPYAQVADVGGLQFWHRDTGLDVTKVYYYVVTAHNAAGSSGSSNEACGRPLPWMTQSCDLPPV